MRNIRIPQVFTLIPGFYIDPEYLRAEEKGYCEV